MILEALAIEQKDLKLFVDAHFWLFKWRIWWMKQIFCWNLLLITVAVNQSIRLYLTLFCWCPVACHAIGERRSPLDARGTFSGVPGKQGRFGVRRCGALQPTGTCQGWSVIFRKVLVVMFDKWWGASSVCVCVCALLYPLCNMFIAWPRCFSVMRCFILDNLLVETARNVEQEFLGTVHVSSLLSSLGNPFG